MVRLALAAVLAAVATASVATVDHRHKGAVENAAQEDAWYCAHGRPPFCRDFDEVAYEQRWENRELVYRVAFFAFSASALALIGTALWSRTLRVRGRES
jgi:hypothetical protein